MANIVSIIGNDSSSSTGDNDSAHEPPIEGILHELSLIELIFWYAMYSAIALFSVGGNLLVIYVTVNRSLMQSVTSLFIVNLAISDLITGNIDSVRLNSWLICL